MRITHVVTLVSRDGAYGGPVSVATGQLGELAARGHEVELVALWRGAGPPPDAVDGVPLRARPARTLVPGQGFLGLFHPGLLPLLWRRVGRAEVLQLHAGAVWCRWRRSRWPWPATGRSWRRRTAWCSPVERSWPGSSTGSTSPCCGGRPRCWC
ncbi:hypothetical protein [Streptomyces noursei]|uniref:hypothetical protein n=1 Tax=Streptomyces noursei TaxID=1971 RepID=UPI001F0336A1|nr:hypothetical protein [Streptomyces noursei]